VRLRLGPSDGGFHELFSESARHLVVGAELLAEMLAEDADHEDVAARMRAAERAADETNHALVRRINDSFVTPFDRSDVYALGDALDDVMDRMDAAVDMVLLYRVKRMPEQVSDQVTVLQRCAELTAAAMPRLRSLRGLDEYWIQVHSQENAGDRIHRHLVAHALSGEFKALEALKVKDLADTLESAVDGFERVAAIVEQIAVKEG
jgi:uncharacterized protein